MTQDEANAAIAAMQPHNRVAVEVIKTSHNKHMAYVRACHAHSWPGDWAEYVWSVVNPDDAPDDIPF